MNVHYGCTGITHVPSYAHAVSSFHCLSCSDADARVIILMLSVTRCYYFDESCSFW